MGRRGRGHCSRNLVVDPVLRDASRECGLHQVRNSIKNFGNVFSPLTIGCNLENEVEGADEQEIRDQHLPPTRQQLLM